MIFQYYTELRKSYQIRKECGITNTLKYKQHNQVTHTYKLI